MMEWRQLRGSSACGTRVERIRVRVFAEEAESDQVYERGADRGGELGRQIALHTLALFLSLPLWRAGGVFTLAAPMKRIDAANISCRTS